MKYLFSHRLTQSLILGKKILNRLRSFIRNFLFLQLYWFSFFVPRRKDIWIFGSWLGRNYADNSKWLFEYICQNEKGIRAIWLTRESGILHKLRRQSLEVYFSNSFKGYWYSCRAGLVIVSWSLQDINILGVSRAKRINLWHGSPMKKIGHDDNVTKRRMSNSAQKMLNMWLLIFPFLRERFDMVIACSEAFRPYMASAMGVNINQVKVTGYPRNDLLFLREPHAKLFLNSININHDPRHVVLYAPTFRNKIHDMNKLFDTFDLDEYEQMLEQNDAILLIKMHYVYLQSPRILKLQKDRASRIFWLDEHTVPEINPILPYIDVLITDYSGVYFDYLILNKPVIFAPFDLDDYLLADRELYEDYDSFTFSGHTCKTWVEVMRACLEIFTGTDKYLESRKLAQSRFNRYLDSHNCARVVEEAKIILNLDS